ncbi:MAG: hypothetical protein HY002_01855 [Candidatus Rokubacteria bacterium]|nr:hypothetical protein [Candidatus Rokubacteria bacterium]
MRRSWLSLLAAGLLGLVLGRPAAANHVVMHGGPFAGVVVQLIAHPEEPGTLYLAAFGSGVYKSVDGGRQWVASSRGLEDPAVLTLALDPVSPRILYAGTDSGVFVSRDGGAAWRRAGRAIAARNIRSLVVQPERPTVLYAATDQGVFWSWDQGRAWAPRREGLDARDIRVLRLDPAHPGRIYAGGFGGVYRSEDGGRRWQGMNQGLTDRRVRALVLDPTRPDALYAGTAGSGVFVTTDGGGHWEPLNDGLRNRTVLSLLATSDGERFAGTVGGVYRWDAAGSSWQLVGEDVLTLTVTVVATNPHRPGTLYAGTGGLVFVSQDHGRQWRELAVSVAGPAGLRPGASAAGRPPGASHVERR